MRRSCAPSMRKAKPTSATIQNNSAAATTQPQISRNFGKNLDNKPSFSNDKRVFNVIWRECNNRKHKTWLGDALFEVDLQQRRGVLLDDTGKFMGSLKISNIDNLAPDLQLVIGRKEIEIQEEIKDINQYWAIRKSHVSNRNWGETTWEEDNAEPEQKKPKASFVFKPNLVLSAPQIPIVTSGRNDFNVPTKIINQSSDHGKKWKNFVEKTENLKCSNENKKQLLKSNKSIVKIEPLILAKPSEIICEQIGIRNIKSIQVANTLVQHLRPHQRQGVVFLYECLMGFREKDCYGCILADEMGLGKTLQCLTIAHTLLRSGPFTGDRVLQRVLIIAPSSLTANWNNEINKWLKTERMFGYVVNAKHKLNAYTHQSHIPFIIVSYETLLTHAVEFQQLNFDLLICDEGHRLKNQSTKIFVALNDMNIKRRILLTGTPIQNDLQEFYTLADFVNPNIFGTYQEFNRYYAMAIQQSQCPSASKEVKELAEERTAELNRLSSKFLLRRLQDINMKYLPKKEEFICFVRPSELQQFMLQKSLEIYEKRKDSILQDLSPLQIITILKKICNHPSNVAHAKNPNVLTRYLERQLPDWSEMGPFDSGKLELIQNFLTTTAVERHEKCVLVSNHTKTLNMLQGLCDYLNIKTLRLDGSMAIAERNQNIEKFNHPTNSDDDNDPLVFLLSAKAGGVGLNLIGASRLILFDNDWNPATDAQAMSRIWRDGQLKNVQIYRLITAGCIEEKIFQRQIAKLTLGDCVIQTNKKTEEAMKFTQEELLDLFTLQDNLNVCQTHESLHCDCEGNGQNLNGSETNDNTKDIKAINDLRNWQHYGPPFTEAFLERTCLNNNSDNLLYIFANETELNI